MQKLTSILITGANGALGRQAVEHYAGRKLNVVAACRNAVERSQLQEYLSERKFSVPVLEADLAHEGQVKRLATEAEHKAGGKLDAVLNVAGAFEMFRTVDAEKTVVDRLFDANFTSNWLLLKHCLPAMSRRGFGRVVFISAAATQGPAGGSMGFYAASKAALNALVQSTAQETAEQNIHINALMPTIIDTPRNRADMPGADTSKWVKGATLLEAIDRFLDPAEGAPTGTLVKVG